MHPRDSLFVYTGLVVLVALAFESLTYALTFLGSKKQSVVLDVYECYSAVKGVVMKCGIAIKHTCKQAFDQVGRGIETVFTASEVTNRTTSAQDAPVAAWNFRP